LEFLCFTGLFSSKVTDEKRQGWKSSGEALAEFNSDDTAEIEDEGVGSENEYGNEESEKSKF
jgi:NhaC family Na+:H+ antiporter